MRIKKFIEFNEAISGTELIGKGGVGYGETGLPNKTINNRHTLAMSSKDLDNPYSNNPLTSDIYFGDQYSDILNNYLKNGGDQSELSDDKSLNMKIMVDFLHNAQN